MEKDPFEGWTTEQKDRFQKAVMMSIHAGMETLKTLFGLIVASQTPGFELGPALVQAWYRKTVEYCRTPDHGLHYSIVKVRKLVDRSC